MNELAEQVTAMVAEAVEVSAAGLSPASRLLEDLGMDGDDAVEFFQAFEARFSPDLAPLYRNWSRHFGPEGLGFSDIRANWAVVGALGVFVAAGAGLLPVWSAGPGVVGLGSAQGRKHRPHLAITIGDLMAAAESGRWPLAYSRPVAGG